MRRMTTLLIAAALLSLALAAPASADLGSKLVADFGDDGALNPCKYTSSELGQIKSLIANDTDAYSPDLRSAIDAMLERNAEGACNKKKTPAQSGGGGSTTPGGAGSTGTPNSGSGQSAPTQSSNGSGATAPGVAKPAPTPGNEATAAPLISNDAINVAARSDDPGDLPPVPLLVLAALMALMALGAIVYGVIRFTGWEPSWAPRARHAAAEAGWRASSTWAEFTDFVRFGR
jgi:cobalamin biosynthesis Mg chelatase CobN